MRPYLLTFFLLITVQLIHAQVTYKQGTVYLDGTTSLTIGNERYIQPENTWSNPPVPEFSGVNVHSLPVGVFAFDRLLVGASITSSYNWSGETFFDGDNSSHQYRVNPFVRYYVLAGEERKWNLFTELGFGTFGGGDLPSFETDFHLGAGVDVPLFPGVVATGRLAYNANADGLNFTTLRIGGNLLLGQLGSLTENPLAKGTWTTQGQLASASFGHMRRGGEDWVNYGYQFNPAVGYFLMDGLSISSVSSLSLSGSQNDISSNLTSRMNNFRFHRLQTELAVRYYPWQTGKLLPFAELSVGYRSSDYSFPEGGVQDQRQTSTVLGAAAGASYFLSENVALEVSAAYQRDSQVNTFDGLSGSSLRYRRLNLETGFAYYFGN